MKVNISYSVALEEVLPLVQKLYKEHKKEFNSTFSTAATIVESSFTDEQLEAIVGSINKMRLGMVKFDTKLEECVNIIGGYHNIIHQEVPQEEPEENQEGDAVDEPIPSG